jgi:hypothetical protein
MYIFSLSSGFIDNCHNSLNLKESLHDVAMVWMIGVCMLCQLFEQKWIFTNSLDWFESKNQNQKNYGG